LCHSFALAVPLIGLAEKSGASLKKKLGRLHPHWKAEPICALTWRAANGSEGRRNDRIIGRSASLLAIVALALHRPRRSRAVAFDDVLLDSHTIENILHHGPGFDGP